MCHSERTLTCVGRVLTGGGGLLAAVEAAFAAACGAAFAAACGAAFAAAALGASLGLW